MNASDQPPPERRSAALSSRRAFLALAIAVLADLLQIMLMPVTWTFAQAAVDVAAMLLVVPILGFHLLLLPTFIIEFIPGVDMLPTWTGCVIAVIAMRKRSRERDESKQEPPAIDVSEVKKPQPQPPRIPDQPK